MASDEEFRRVAEDVRALARSLARDFWEASSSARGSGRPTSEAFRHGLRGAARGFRSGMGHDRRGWSRPQAGPPWAQWGPWPPVYRYRRPPRRPRRGPLPPVRRRWDASLLAAILVVVFGLAWLLGGLSLVPHVSVEAVLALGLMLLGASLIMTARTDWSLSRHAWPVVLGAVLVVGLFATSTSFGVDGALSHLSLGNMHPTPSGPGGTVYGGFGQLDVDTSRVGHGTLDIQSVAGQTTVTLGTGQAASVDAHVLAGQICIGGRISSGLGASAGPVQVGQGVPTVTINIHQIAGQVVVRVPGEMVGCGRA